MMKKSWIISLVLGLFLSFSASAIALKGGVWRFELATANAKIPFIITFFYENDEIHGQLQNGEETIELKDIKVSGKNVSIPLQNYQNSLELTLEDFTHLSGHFVKHNKEPKVKIPVRAEYGKSARFPGRRLKKTSIDLTGKWSVTLSEGPSQIVPGILIFKQKNNAITGSILTPTGDYRYFEGYVSGENFEAASFDGVYNYLIVGSVHKKRLTGTIRSSTLTKIEGKLDPNAKLPDPYQQTQLDSLSFSFPDLEGKTVTLNDERFKDKPVIVQFFGSWCPNCIDEMNYLIPWYLENSKRGVEIVALAFERGLSSAESKKQLKKIQDKMKVPYPLLLAGITAEEKPTDKIKGLKNFISFPTTVFLNKKHEVTKVHAGFNGPSTGEFFEKWKVEFNQTINELLK